MIVGYENKLVNSRTNQHIVQTGYINDQGQITVEKHSPKFNNWVVCNDNDPDKNNQFKSLMGESIKQKPAVKFFGDNLREWCIYDSPKKLQENLKAFNKPNCYSVDIEIDMEKCHEFPDPVESKYPVESISITAPNLNTIILTKGDKFNDQDILDIEEEINDLFNQYETPKKLIELNGKIKFSVLKFSTEHELLVYYFNLQHDLLHTLIGWNWDSFDTVYIANRAEKLGIDRGISSPVGEIDKQTNKPKFRIEYDYMTLVEKYAYQYITLRKRLNDVATNCLGVGKVEYEGTFRDLFADYKKFLFYGAVDTILVQMIHMVTDAVFTPLMLSYYAKVPMDKINGVTIVAGALFFDELYNSNIIHCNYEKQHRIIISKESDLTSYFTEPRKPNMVAVVKKGNKNTIYYLKERTSGDNLDDWVKFEGGFVMNPRRLKSEWFVVLDYSAQYPRVIQNLNCSPEAIIGVANNKFEFDEALKAGHAVSLNGNIYKNTSSNMVKRVIDKLIDERYTYKGYQMHVFNKFQVPLQKELNNRNIKY